MVKLVPAFYNNNYLSPQVVMMYGALVLRYGDFYMHSWPGQAMWHTDQNPKTRIFTQHSTLDSYAQHQAFETVGQLCGISVSCYS